MIQLSREIANLIEHARSFVVKTANSTMVNTYFSIGKLIVEEVQHGDKRAEYGSKLLFQVSQDLSQKFGKGFSIQNLERMRNFYSIYSKSSNNLRNSEIFEKSSNVLRISVNDNQIISLLPLSWSHYLVLMRIDNELERNFYEVESYNGQWGIKELERQINSGLFSRLSLSKDYKGLLQLAQKGQIVEKPEDLIKEPLVLEFLGLEEKNSYTESDLETAIINQIESFMLELGKGFFFGGRQVRFTFDEEHFFVDLVFYNRLLQCFVLIDLKIGKLKHQDIGQMQMYVNYYDRHIKQDFENPSIGIIICKDKNNTLVEMTLPKDNNHIFASKYQILLPSKEDFEQIINHNIVK